MLQERSADGVTWLTFDRPERLNAFTPDAYAALRSAVLRAGSDPDARAIVLTGNGRAFSAGADRSLVDGTATRDERDRASEEFAALFDAIDSCDTPILAAVNGVAVGVGCTLLLHCDLVLVAESARLRLPFTALGMVPEAGSSALLPMQARWPDALWAMLSSEWLSAADAHALGLAWQVVPDAALVARTAEAAATLAALDPAAVAATKRLLHAGRADVVAAAMARESAAMRSLNDQPG